MEAVRNLCTFIMKFNLHILSVYNEHVTNFGNQPNLLKKEAMQLAHT